MDNMAHHLTLSVAYIIGEYTVTHHCALFYYSNGQNVTDDDDGTANDLYCNPISSDYKYNLRCCSVRDSISVHYRCDGGK